MQERILNADVENYAQGFPLDKVSLAKTPADSNYDEADQLQGERPVIERADTSFYVPQGTQRDIFTAPKMKIESGGSQAFRLEYGPQTPRQAIYDDVITYLGEYRLQSQETFYDLVYSKGEDGLQVRDMNRGDSMLLAAKKAIVRGDKRSRRVAEYEALEKENQLLAEAEDGDMLIQASPPGKIVKEDGSYGFIFVSVVEKINDEYKIIHKNAIRINDASIDQYNQAMSAITGQPINHETSEGLIADPHFLGKAITYKDIKDTLNQAFNFEPSASERRRNEWIIEQVKPYINYFIDKIHNGDSGAEVFNFLEKIENKVLELKENYKDTSITLDQSAVPLTDQAIDDFNNRYNYKPPVTGGSCGSTGSGSSFGSAAEISFTAGPSFSGKKEDRYGPLTFTCHNGHPNTRDAEQLKEYCDFPGCGKIPRC